MCIGWILFKNQFPTPPNLNLLDVFEHGFIDRGIHAEAKIHDRSQW